MRERLNNDPKVQLAIFGIAALGVALLLVMRMGGGATDQEPAATSTPPATAAPPAAGATSEVAPQPSASGAIEPGAPSTAPAAQVTGDPADGLLPTKGLPEEVLVAYARNEVIALLVIDPRSPVGKRLKASAKHLESRPGVAAFVVDVAKIARYSRITLGVSVSQTPALVVVRPRKLNEEGPTATVSYGFREPKSFSVAIDEALYEGGEVPAYP